VSRSRMLVFGTRVNGSISTAAVTSSGSRVAAIVTAPPAKEWPISTAGPPRACTTASRSPARAARLKSGHGAGLPLTAGVERGDAVPGGHQLRREETVGLSPAAHAGNQDHERSSPAAHR